MSEPPREIYSHPPLEVVAFELRIPHSLHLADKAAQAQVWERIRTTLPLTQPQPTLQVGLGAPMLQQAQQPLRMLDRSRTRSVVIGSEAIVVENTSYRCFEEFCELLREVLAALPAEEIAGFTRIGLRYVNEIRVDGVSELSDWDGVVNGSLLAAAAFAPNGISADRLGGDVEYATAAGHRVLMRYGLFSGRVVNLDGPLQTRTSDSKPSFLVDLDSYWESPPGEELPHFSTEAVLRTTSELREPIHELFEAAVTDRLRDVFREERT